MSPFLPENSWARKLIHFYTFSFYALLIAWSLLFYVNFLYPFLAAPDMEETFVTADAVSAEQTHGIE